MIELIEFPEANSVYGKDQPEYVPLPCHKVPGDPDGVVVFCWRMTWKQRLKVLFTGKLWHLVKTFNKPIQPQHLNVDKPEMNTNEPTENR